MSNKNKTDQKKLTEFIRVDHAGERGAVKIYEGQLLALNTIIKNKSLKKTIEEMRVHEKEHCEFFEKEIKIIALASLSSLESVCKQVGRGPRAGCRCNPTRRSSSPALFIARPSSKLPPPSPPTSVRPSNPHPLPCVTDLHEIGEIAMLHAWNSFIH